MLPVNEICKEEHLCSTVQTVFLVGYLVKNRPKYQILGRFFFVQKIYSVGCPSVKSNMIPPNKPRFKKRYLT